MWGRIERENDGSRESRNERSGGKVGGKRREEDAVQFFSSSLSKKASNQIEGQWFMHRSYPFGTFQDHFPSSFFFNNEYNKL